VNFFAETLEAEREKIDRFKTPKEKKNCQPRIL
jgi:hypothetical protein